MIITDESKLRLDCEDVLIEEVDDLVSKLEFELEKSASLGRPGIGLAAPQIGIAKKIAIVRLVLNGNYDLNVNLVNCKIEKCYDLALFKDEGCLSYPGRLEDTMRYQEIYVTNNLVYPHSFIATGLQAVVIQHELDHINKVLLPDNAIKKPSTSIINKPKKVGPNDPCVCGKIDPILNKIKKFKRCCGK